MARKSQRDRNLEEAKHKRRNAQNKVTRLEAQGIHIRKAEIAPIVSLGELESMSARQLRSHIKELERFNSRETGFVKGLNGEPLRRADVQELHRLQAVRNAQVDSINHIVAGMPNLPGQDQTPLERAKTLSSSRTTGVAGRLTDKVWQVPEFITSQESLQKLIAGEKARAAGRGFLANAVNRRMNSIDALLENSGYADLKREVHKLTSEQQLILMEMTTFSEVARDRFGSGEDGRARVERMDRDYNLRNGSDRADDIRADLNTIIQYVKDNTVALSSARNTTNRGRATRSSSGRRKK